MGKQRGESTSKSAWGRAGDSLIGVWLEVSLNEAAPPGVAGRAPRREPAVPVCARSPFTDRQLTPGPEEAGRRLGAQKESKMLVGLE